MNSTRRQWARLLTGTSVAVFSVALASDGAQKEAARPESRGTARAVPSLGRLPLDFIENRGQWGPSPAKFVARKGLLTAALEDDAIRLFLGTGQPTSLGLTFEGASKKVALTGEQKRSGLYHYYIGNDPAKWQSQVTAYGSVLYRGLYDGIDMRVREEAGRLEYDLLSVQEPISPRS